MLRKELHGDLLSRFLIETVDFTLQIYVKASKDDVLSLNLGLCDDQVLIKVLVEDVESTELLNLNHASSVVETELWFRPVVPVQLVLASLHLECDNLRRNVAHLLSYVSELLSDILVSLAKHRIERLLLPQLSGREGSRQSNHRKSGPFDWILGHSCSIEELGSQSNALTDPLQACKRLI